MCRVIIASKAAVEEYNKKHGLMNLLTHLEKQCGGHGNGVALYNKKGARTVLIKGVKTSVKDVYNTIMRAKDWETLLFHTRIASCGEIGDERCHPFSYGRGESMLAMNGTLHELTELADALGITDTEVVAKLMYDLKDIEEVVKLLKTTGAVFVGVHEGGKPYAVKGRGALEEYVSKKGFFFASSFPASVVKTDVKGLPYHFSYVDGEYRYPPKPSVKYSTKSSFTYGGYFKPETATECDNWGLYDSLVNIMDKTSADDGSALTVAYSDDDDDDDYETLYKMGYEEGFTDGYSSATTRV